MIKRSDDKIGIRGIIAIICITIGLKVTDMTPSILYSESKNSVWISTLVGGFVILIPLYFLLMVLKKNNNKGLIEIIYDLTGKYIGFIISILLFLILFIGTTINSRNYVDILHTLYFPRTPIYALLIGGYLSSYLIANRGLQALSWGSWAFFFWIKFAFALVLILSLKDADFGFLYPLGGPGTRKLIKNGIEYIPIYGELILLAIVYPFIKDYKTIKRGIIIGFIIAIFELTIFYMMFVAIFDYPTIEKIAFPFHQLTRFIDIGRFFSNLESLLLGFWVIGTVLRISFYLYLTTVAFSHSLKIKEFEPLLLPMMSLMIMTGLIPNSTIDTIFLYRDNLIIDSSYIVFITLPIMLWILTRIKGGRKNC